MATRRTRITKPSELKNSDKERLAQIRSADATPAKNLEETVGKTYISSPENRVGFSSSKELDIDFSDFSNHTFFNSAEANVGVAFSKILSSGDNSYPYYGSDSDYENWLATLTGFENYVFEVYPRNAGFLYFDEVSYVLSKDVSNSLLATERLLDGQGTVNPKTGSMTVEFHLNPLKEDTLIASTGTIFDFTNSTSTQGYQINLITTGSVNYLQAFMVSGSRTEEARIEVPRNQFNHYACVFDRKRELDRVQIYANSNLSGTSNRKNEIRSVDVTGGVFYIGNNSIAGNLPGTQFLSASVDEFRVWSTARTPEQLSIFSKRSIRAQSNLELLYTFNNPNYTDQTGGPSRSIYVTDFSGNEIHGQIISYDQNNTRQTTGSVIFGLNPMTFEIPSPILQSDHPDVEELYKFLSTRAVQYDQDNPNLITKLIPPKILEMSKTGIDPQTELEARVNKLSQFDSYIQGIQDTKTSDIQGVLQAFLFVVGKFFDELKIFIDQFSYLSSESYLGKRFPDQLLDVLLKQYGLDFTGIFDSTDLDKFLRGENVVVNGDVISETLQQIRGKIWRRIFNATIGILKQKGTRDSLDGMFRLLGIDPSSNFKIKEYGGFNQKNIENRFIRSAKPTPFFDFNSGSNGLEIPAFKIYNQSSNISPPNGFHVEYLVSLPNNQGSAPDQSLGRMMLANPFSGTWDVYSNIIAYSSRQGNPRIEWSYQPVSSTLDPVSVSLEGTFFDGRVYRFAYGRKMRTSGTLGNHNADYYISMTPVEYDDIDGTSFTSAVGTTNNDFISNGLPSPFLSTNVIHFIGENWTTGSIPEAYFTGSFFPQTKTAQFKFAEFHSYDTFINSGQTREVHEKNPFSISLDAFAENLDERKITYSSASINLTDVLPHGKLFNVIQFDQASGSIGETLPTKFSPLGAINGLELVNFAQSYSLDIASGTIDYYQSLLSSSIPLGTDPRVFEVIQYKELTSDWDRAGADSLNRVVVREGSDAVDPNPELLPEYDPRVAIDFSVSDILNEDIMLIISSIDRLGNSIASYRNRFDYDFQELEYLRKVYFKRLEDRIQLQEFFKFFKYFDDNIIDFISPLIPAKVEFLGGRFIIEPHALERGKYVYQDYNGLFSPGKSPREIREGVNVPVLEGSLMPVGSEVGGLTMGRYHTGGSVVQGPQNTIVGGSQVNSVIRIPWVRAYADAITQSGVLQRPIDYDEIMPFSFKRRLFKKGNSEFIRDLFDSDPSDLNIFNFDC